MPTEEFQSLLQEVASIQEFLSRVGLRAAGGNHTVFRARAAKDNIDLTALNQRRHEKRVSYPRPHAQPLVEILTERSPYSRSQLKKRLFKTGTLKEICSECIVGPEWAGKPLTLTLDHINGIHDDNRLENLRILCPNCHSQTPTFAGRNNKKPPRFCKDCQRPISRRAVRCRKCNNIGRPRQTKITRPTKINWPPTETLRQMVVAKSFLAVGRELGVSDNAIRKRIKNHPET